MGREQLAEVMQFQTALQQAKHEKDMLQSSVADLQRRCVRGGTEDRFYSCEFN